MQLEAEIIDSDVDRELVMNKMVKTLKQETLWTKTEMVKLVYCLVICSLAKESCLQL